MKKLLFVLYLVVGTFFISPSFAQEAPFPPRVEQEIDQALNHIEMMLRMFRRELPGVIERIERLQKELEKPLPPRKPPMRELPGQDI